jgi:hypothetical protein
VTGFGRNGSTGSIPILVKTDEVAHGAGAGCASGRDTKRTLVEDARIQLSTFFVLRRRFATGISVTERAIERPIVGGRLTDNYAKSRIVERKHVSVNLRDTRARLARGVQLGLNQKNRGPAPPCGRVRRRVGAPGTRSCQEPERSQLIDG